MEKQTLPPRGSKMFQVYEEDLAQLENDLPELLECTSTPAMTNAHRVMWRRVIETIKNIRWNYGPPGQVISFPANEEPPQ